MLFWPACACVTLHLVWRKCNEARIRFYLGISRSDRRLAGSDSGDDCRMAAGLSLAVLYCSTDGVGRGYVSYGKVPLDGGKRRQDRWRFHGRERPPYNPRRQEGRVGK